MAGADPRDPRFKNFRRAALGVYLVFAVVFSVLIIFSVFKSVLEMTPERPQFSGAALPEDECLRQARTLYGQLEEQRGHFADFPSVDAEKRFVDFRLTWLERARRVEAQCATSERPRLAPVFASLERVMDLYATSSAQFAGAMGPALDALERTLQSP